MFIDPGLPWQNAWIESFDGRLCDELTPTESALAWNKITNPKPHINWTTKRSLLTSVVDFGAEVAGCYPNG
jgi:hypothetical protein